MFPSLRLSRARRRASVTVLATGLVAVALSACQPAPPPNAAGDRPTGVAYTARGAITALAGAKAGLAPVALESIPCNRVSGVETRNSVASVLLPVQQLVGSLDLVKTGVGTNSGRATFDHAAGTSDEVQTATVAGVDLLGGVITADSVVGQVHVSRSTGGTVDRHVGEGASGTGATLVNLRIAGVVVPADPAPNTVVALPGGIGSVTL